MNDDLFFVDKKELEKENLLPVNYFLMKGFEERLESSYRIIRSVSSNKLKTSNYVCYNFYKRVSQY